MAASAYAPLIEFLVAEGFDCTSALRLHSRLEEALSMRPQRLVVDLSRCPSFDAAGLRALLDMHCSCVAAGTELVLRAPSARVLRVLELTGLGDVFTVR